MAIKVNPAGVEFAEQRIGEGDYRISTVWRQAQPSPTAAARFLDENGIDEYARWHLAVETDEPRTSPAHYTFPIGDFRSVHRSGLIAAQQDAAKHGYEDVEEAANELIFFFDRISAC